MPIKFDSDGPFLREVNKISDLKGTEAAFISSRPKLLTDLKTALSKRFVDKFHEDVLKCTKILKFENWPKDMENATGNKT